MWYAACKVSVRETALCLGFTEDGRAHGLLERTGRGGTVLPCPRCSSEVPEEIWMLMEATCSVGSVATGGACVTYALAFVSLVFLTVGNLFHLRPFVFLEVLVTSSFNFLITTTEILGTGVMGLWCARGFVLMSLALWFTPAFSQLRLAPTSGNIEPFWD